MIVDIKNCDGDRPLGFLGLAMFRNSDAVVGSRR